MNIWMVNHYAVPPNQPGGTRHYTLGKELVRHGHSVTVIGSSFDHATRTELHLEAGEHYRLENLGGVRFLWLRTPTYTGNTARRVQNMVAFAYQVWRAATHVLGKPGVILGSSPDLFAALAARRVATRYKVPFVLEVRDLWPQSLIDLGHLPRYHPFIVLLERIERYLYRNADRIITLPPGVSGHIQDKGADPSKVIWIPNGIDLEVVPDPMPPRPSEVLTVMYAGAHGLANGLGLVLEAAHLLQKDGWTQRVRFRLIGDGPEKPGLIRRAQELKLVNVSFENPVPKQDVYKLLAEADSFLMVLQNSPLFRWGISPNKLFDYMASARPVIFCVSTSFNPVEQAGAGVTVAPADAATLAQAVRRLAEMSPEERWEMGLRGRRYVEKYYALNRLAGKLEQILCELVEGPAHASITSS